MQTILSHVRRILDHRKLGFDVRWTTDPLNKTPFHATTKLSIIIEVGRLSRCSFQICKTLVWVRLPCARCARPAPTFCCCSVWGGHCSKTVLRLRVGWVACSDEGVRVRGWGVQYGLVVSVCGIKGKGCDCRVRV